MRADLLPMLCQTEALKSVSEVRAEDWTGEMKWDGWRGIVWIEPDGTLHLIGGRNGKEYTGIIQYVERTLLAALPPDTIVDGEITAAAGFGTVQSRMSRHYPHVPSASDPPLTYRIFDVLRWAGEDLRRRPWYAGENHRRGCVERIEPLLAELPHVTVNKLLPVTQDTYTQIVAAGGEGMVLKLRTSRYRNEARAREWRKLKHTLTLEARVTGFKPGTPGSSYDGLVGAIEFELLDTGVRSRCSGFSMDLRHAMSKNPAAYHDRVFTLTLFPGVGPDGKPRSPNFGWWREDRDDLTRQSADSEPSAVDATAVSLGAGRRRTTAPSRPRMRNYASMRPDNLIAAVRSLEAGSGPAYEKCVARGGDPADDLRVARSALEAKAAA